MQSEYEGKEKMLKTELEQALVTRITRLANAAASDLAAEQAVVQSRLDLVTAEFRVRLEAGLAFAETTLQRAEGLMAAEHREEFMQAQRQSFREHDAIRDQVAAVRDREEACECLHQMAVKRMEPASKVGGRRAGERIENGCESGCGSCEQLKLPIGFMWFGILNMYHLE